MISNYFVHDLKHHIISGFRDLSTNAVSKPYYITTPIFYPNAQPHIGHLYSLVTADILARRARLHRRQVVFVTGTDEHGLKIQQTAKANLVKPSTWCTRMSRAFYDLASKADISFSKFVRTTMREHRDAVEHLWQELNSRGYIYEGKHSGWYSISDECFYTDSQITSSLDSETGERISVAMETGNKVEWTEETNYKFALSKFRERLLGHFESNPDAIYPPHQYQLIIEQLRTPDTLSDLSISRPSSRISWGIRVPDDKSQTIYVWLDALTSYLTGLGYPYKEDRVGNAEAAWPPDVQVIGKDILRFHAIYFPAFLMALDLPLPKKLLSHSHWTVDQSKMSKSRGNVVDPFREMEEHTSEAVRWYLARVGGRFKDDVDWSTHQMLKHEFELRSLLGNFFLRIQSRGILARLPPYSRSVPLNRTILLEAGDEKKPGDAVRGSLVGLRDKVDECLEKFEVTEALEAIVDCLTIANKEYTTCEPWVLDTPQDTIIRLQTWSRETLRVCGILLQPFLPAKSAELLDALRIPQDERFWADAAVGVGKVDCGPMERVVLFMPPEERYRKKIDEDFEDVEKDIELRDSSRYKGRYWRHTLPHVDYSQQRSALPVRHSNFLYKTIDEQITPPLVRNARPAPIAPSNV